jgi:hypothetical protein
VYIYKTGSSCFSGLSHVHNLSLKDHSSDAVSQAVSRCGYIPFYWSCHSVLILSFEGHKTYM